MIKSTLPLQPNPLVGRKNELADVNARLLNAECRLLTLTGLGGSGKTRLAIETARTLTPHFPHGVIFVNLQPLTKSSLLISAIAQALNLSFYGEMEPETQLFNYLREKSLLLVLDNFEHLLDKADFVSDMLSQSSKIKILVTSREALNLREEWLYPLKGMSIPLSAYATSLEDYEAVQLFLVHARRVHPGFDLESEREAVIHICRITAGLPLALELAATWLRGLTAPQIATEMEHNLNFLTTTLRNVEDRHRSMRAVFDQSWKLLTENERLVFARLSVFRGGFSVEAAQAVADASLPILAGLVEKSLIQVEASGRYSIHEMLHQYGMEKLADYHETETTRTRHSGYFAQKMRQHERMLQQPQQMEVIHAMEAEFENIRLTWEWASQNQLVEQLDAMLHGLYLFGFLRSRYRETIIMFQQALEQVDTNPLLVARLLTRRWGYLQWWYEADYQNALVLIQQALAIVTAEQRTFEVAFAHLTAAYALIGMQRYADSIPHLDTSRALFEAINEPYYVCWVLHRLGYVHFNLNNNAQATEYTEQSLSLARVTSNRQAMVTCLYNLGSSEIMLGDYVKGRRYCEEALQVATETGHQGQIAHASSLIAACAFFQGDYVACREFAERSHSIIININLLAFQSYCLSLLIVLACLRADYDEAVRLRELAKRHSTNVMGFQFLYWSLSVLSCSLKNPAETRSNIQKLLQNTTLDTEPAIIIWIIPAAAFVLGQTDPELAVELISWISSQTDNAAQWVHQFPAFHQLQNQLQTMMDSENFQTHWENGKTLTFESVSRSITDEFSVIPEDVAGHKSLLTARERDILQLIAAGLTNPQIAKQLVIGAGTVKTHTLSIYRKLDVANRTQAILRAQELGLLTT